MTKERVDKHSTEFGLWLRNKAPDNKTKLREYDPIDSSLGFITTNLDYIWANYKTGDWMLIEEKRFKSSVTYSQSQLLSKVDKLCQSDKQYHGWHVLKFEKTNPEDGEIRLDNEVITKAQLLEFLRFEQ